MDPSISTAQCGRVAFVTGANGITGHALIEHLIRTPNHEWCVLCPLWTFSTSPLAEVDHKCSRDIHISSVLPNLNRIHILLAVLLRLGLFKNLRSTVTRQVYILTRIYLRSKIIITSRTPPKIPWIDPRVQFVSLDFLNSVEVLVGNIQRVCENVTHAFFTSYVHDNDPTKLPEKNCPLFRNFLEAIDTACPILQRVILQTGGKVTDQLSCL